jgi:hypothetical protein
MSMIWSLIGLFTPASSIPPPGTVSAGTYKQTGVNLTGGVDNIVIHGKNKKPSSVTFWESDELTPITVASYDETDANTITVRVQDNVTGCVIKYVF